MKQTNLPPRRRAAARRIAGHAQQGHVLDPYQAQEKLHGGTLCPQCGAVYHEGRWRWAAAAEDGGKALCAACRRTNDNLPAGVVRLHGIFARYQMDEIVRLARHQEDAEKREHPLNRIIGIEGAGRSDRHYHNRHPPASPDWRCCAARLRRQVEGRFIVYPMQRANDLDQWQRRVAKTEDSWRCCSSRGLRTIFGVGFQEVARRGLLARSAAGPSNAHEMPGVIGNEMSVDIAAALRHEAKTAQAVAERQTNRQDKAVLQQLAAKLVEIAERLERDARD